MIKCGLCNLDRRYLVMLPIRLEDGKTEVERFKIGNGQRSLCVDCLKKEIEEHLSW